MFKVVILFLALAITLTRSQTIEETKSPKDVVINEISENDGSGNFYWLRETLDGGRSEQRGYFKNGQQIIEGSYTEITPEGLPLTVNYVADRRGYHPVGDHLPRSP